MADTAKVWKFEDAPRALQDLSTNGGDEDWIVALPKIWMEEGYIPQWVQATDIRKEPMQYWHPTNPDYIIFIWSHA